MYLCGPSVFPSATAFHIAMHVVGAYTFASGERQHDHLQTIWCSKSHKCVHLQASE